MTDQCTVPVSRKLSMIELRKNSSLQTCYASNSSSTDRAVFNLRQKYTTSLKVNLDWIVIKITYVSMSTVLFICLAQHILSFFSVTFKQII